jgi:hypothetical protein
LSQSINLESSFAPIAIKVAISPTVFGSKSKNPNKNDYKSVQFSNSPTSRKLYINPKRKIGDILIKNQAKLSIISPKVLATRNMNELGPQDLEKFSLGKRTRLSTITEPLTVN